MVHQQGIEIARLEGRFAVAEAQVKHQHHDFGKLRADLFEALSTQRGRIDAVHEAVTRIERKVDQVLAGLELLRKVST